MNELERFDFALQHGYDFGSDIGCAKWWWSAGRETHEGFDTPAAARTALLAHFDQHWTPPKPADVVHDGKTWMAVRFDVPKESDHFFGMNTETMSPLSVLYWGVDMCGAGPLNSRRWIAEVKAEWPRYFKWDQARAVYVFSSECDGHVYSKSGHSTTSPLAAFLPFSDFHEIPKAEFDAFVKKPQPKPAPKDEWPEERIKEVLKALDNERPYSASHTDKALVAARMLIDHLRDQIANLAPYKDLHAHALKCVDAVFQEGAQPEAPILPDFARIGVDKFEAVIELAKAYKALVNENESLVRQMSTKPSI